MSGSSLFLLLLLCSKLEKQKEKKRKEEQKRKIASLSFNPEDEEGEEEEEDEEEEEENEEEEQDCEYWCLETQNSESSLCFANDCFGPTVKLYTQHYTARLVWCGSICIFEDSFDLKEINDIL